MENEKISLESLSADKMKFAIGLAVIAIIVAVSLFYLKIYVDNNTSAPGEGGQPAVQNQVEELNPDADLAYFPESAPLPSSAEVVKNVRITSETGEIQVTKLLETSKSVDENFQFFKSGFQTDGWTLISSSNEDSSSGSLIAENGNGTMYVSIDKGAEEGVTLINMSFMPIVE